MANKMLIDAAHPEETRVVVVRGNRVEEFDYESANKKQLRGNIYLAKVTRVEPSLQAAFVDYGGNRHGFLAFNEIHPDYYQIPVADRQLLKEEEAREAAEQRALEDRQEQQRSRRKKKAAPVAADDDLVEIIYENAGLNQSAETKTSSPEEALEDDQPVIDDQTPEQTEDTAEIDAAAEQAAPENFQENDPESDSEEDAGEDETEASADAKTPDTMGQEDALEEVPTRPKRRRRKIYKIQEVIKRGQIILIQVVKEERGNKGAALTTYLSLAGRYTVLMPNTARGGGISRKINNVKDRKRLRDIADAIEVPDGTGLIVRTAGASRTKAEIKRDFDYLLRLWENIRKFTLGSSAPALIYEEGNLIKRSIRDLYSKEIDEVLVAGDVAYREAKDFMRLIMPSHAKNVHHYKDPEPLFMRYQVERQLNAMFNPQVKLKSGGYIVINQTEALVAIDVNSGKSTREFSIEETALNTNLEAAEEVARQLRLRDLAGLIVIDFIDMDERKNNRAVEQMQKNSLKSDRARIQVGHISAFGLLEMSRQRLRTGVLEGSTAECPHCMGTGIIRSTESVALYVLRSVEDMLMSGPKSNLKAITTPDAALYILNHKREYLREIELHFGVNITVEGSPAMQGATFNIEKTAGPLPVHKQKSDDQPSAVSIDWAYQTDDTSDEADEPEQQADNAEPQSEEEGRRKRSRRSRRRKPKTDAEVAVNSAAHGDTEQPDIFENSAPSSPEEATEGKSRRPRRRGRRGGRGRDNANREAAAPGETTEMNERSDDTAADRPADNQVQPEPVVVDVISDNSIAAEPPVNGSAPEPVTVTMTEAVEIEQVGRQKKTSSEPKPETAPAMATPAEEPEDQGPKKRGWWQRRLG